MSVKNNSRFAPATTQKIKSLARTSLAVVGVGLLGFVTLRFSHAATFATSQEAESGLVAGSATAVSDANASGNSAVLFGGGPVLVTPPPVTGGQSLTTYGAKCDGETDDTAALQAALTGAAATITIPDGTCLIKGNVTMTATNLKIYGTSVNSTLLFMAAGNGITARASNITMAYFKLVHGSAASAAILQLDSASAFIMDNLIFDGRIGLKSDGGTAVGIGFGSASNLRITNTAFTNLSTAIGSTDDLRSSVSDVVIDHSTFTRNNGLEVGLLTKGTNGSSNITVSNSTFKNNQYGGTSQAVGAAVRMGSASGNHVTGNSFDGYAAQPVQILTNSSNINIDNNTFSNSSKTATADAAYIYVNGSASAISAASNTIDTTGNANPVYCFYATAGTTSGGLSNLTGRNNTCKLGEISQGKVSFGPWQLTGTVTP